MAPMRFPGGLREGPGASASSGRCYCARHRMYRRFTVTVGAATSAKPQTAAGPSGASVGGLPNRRHVHHLSPTSRSCSALWAPGSASGRPKLQHAVIVAQKFALDRKYAFALMSYRQRRRARPNSTLVLGHAHIEGGAQTRCFAFERVHSITGATRGSCSFPANDSTCRPTDAFDGMRYTESSEHRTLRDPPAPWDCQLLLSYCAVALPIATDIAQHARVSGPPSSI